jgi:hypothetical protein
MLFSKAINISKLNKHKKGMRKILFFVVSFTLVSCATNQRSNFKTNEEFVIELKKPASRGLVDLALKGAFFGATYLAERSTQSLTNSYRQSISISDYYSLTNEIVEKKYKKIEIRKYAKPADTESKQRARQILADEINSLPKSRASSIELADLIREEQDDFLNFKAVIELISDPNNPSITRLSFNELYIFFSKTKVYKDEDLNVKMLISIDGIWRSKSSESLPFVGTLIEHEFNFKDLKYSAENQLSSPVLSPWYYDLPISSGAIDNSFGIVNIHVELVEYEGNKSKYVNKAPNLLSTNKSKILQSGSLIEKILN